MLNHKKLARLASQASRSNGVQINSSPAPTQERESKIETSFPVALSLPISRLVQSHS